MSSMNKTKVVLQWLQTGAGISSMEAIKQFGANRLVNKMTFDRYYLRDDADSQQDEKL